MTKKTADAFGWDDALTCHEPKPPKARPEPITGPELSQYEAAALGCIIQFGDEDEVREAASAASHNLWSDPVHRALANIVLDLARTGKPTDVFVVREAARKAKVWQQLGVKPGDALQALQDASATPSYLPYYLGELRKAARARDELLAARRLAEAHKSEDANAVLAARDQLNALATASDGHQRAPEGLSLADLADHPIDEAQTLLGTNGVRYLCRGGAMLFIGPSGIGKSTAGAQMDIMWALGKSAFGIPAARPLRILTIQAENDIGDLTIMARGILGALNLSDEDRNIVRSNTIYVTHRDSTGPSFLTFVRLAVKHYRPDILRIDPFQAYLGADPSDPEKTAAFCRNGLNCITEEHGCAVIVAHHTPKTNNANRDTTKWKASDWQYSGAGSADLTNWARAVLVVDPIAEGVFKFIAAKRWPGWDDGAGGKVFERYFQHAKQTVCWEDASPADAEEAKATRGGRPNGPTDEELKDAVSHILLTEGCPVSKMELYGMMKTQIGIGRMRSIEVVTTLLRKRVLKEVKNGRSYEVGLPTQFDQKEGAQ